MTSLYVQALKICSDGLMLRFVVVIVLHTCDVMFQPYALQQQLTGEIFRAVVKRSEEVCNFLEGIEWHVDARRLRPPRVSCPGFGA